MASPRLRLRAIVVSLLPVLLVLSGCGSSARPGAADDATRVPGSLTSDPVDQAVSDEEDAVARRSRATPDEIFSAGQPYSLEVRPDGSFITVWNVSADTGGEGPAQRAWRVFDADGRRVAQGRLSQLADVLAVGDGFLVLDVELDRFGDVMHIDPDGDRSRVEVSDQRQFPGRGDTFVPDLDTFYRLSDRTLATSPLAPGLPRGGVAAGRNTALTDTGLLYQYADPPRSPLPLGVTADAGRHWRYTQVPVDGFLASLVAARGQDVVMVLNRRAPRGIASLIVSADAGRTWLPADLPAGLPVDAYVDHLEIGSDDRPVLGSYGTGWWRAEPGDLTSYAQLPVPDGGVSDVHAATNRLFAMSASGIWRSDDGGEYWTMVDVSS